MPPPMILPQGAAFPNERPSSEKSPLTGGGTFRMYQGRIDQSVLTGESESVEKGAHASPSPLLTRFPPLRPSAGSAYCTFSSQTSNLSNGLLNQASNSCNSNPASSLPRNPPNNSPARPSALFGSCDFNTATTYSTRNSRLAPAGRRSRKGKTRSSRRRKIRARVWRAGEDAKIAGVKVRYCEMRFAPT